MPNIRTLWTPDSRVVAVRVTIYATCSAVLFPTEQANPGHCAPLFRVQWGTGVWVPVWFRFQVCPLQDVWPEQIAPLS